MLTDGRDAVDRLPAAGVVLQHRYEASPPLVDRPVRVAQLRRRRQGLGRADAGRHALLVQPLVPAIMRWCLASEGGGDELTKLHVRWMEARQCGEWP